jgi:hypothetical protein
MRLTLACLLVLALIAGAACTPVAETPPETSPPTTAPPTQAPPTTPPPATTPAQVEETIPPATEEAVTPEDIEAARQVVFAYWEAYNSYDVDGVLALLEDSWREERADEIAGEIGQMKMFGVTLEVEEEAEPAITDETVGIEMLVNTPLGAKHYIYYLKEIGGEWRIYFAEEV